MHEWTRVWIFHIIGSAWLTDRVADCRRETSIHFRVAMSTYSWHCCSRHYPAAVDWEKRDWNAKLPSLGGVKTFTFLLMTWSCCWLIPHIFLALVIASGWVWFGPLLYAVTMLLFLAYKPYLNLMLMKDVFLMRVIHMKTKVEKCVQTLILCCKCDVV